MTRCILTARDQVALLAPWRRRAMSYWVADGTEPVHHIPTAEILGYRPFDPRNPPNIKTHQHEPADHWLIGDEESHMDKPWQDEQDFNDSDEPPFRPSLTESVRSEGIRTPVEILTDGKRAYLGDGVHRSTVAHELGMTHVPAHVIHVKPDDLDFYAGQGSIMRNRSIPPVGPAVRAAIEIGNT